MKRVALLAVALGLCLLAPIGAMAADADFDAIRKAYTEGQFDQASTRAKALVERDPEREGLDAFLITAGGELAQAGRYDAAATFYRLHVQAFPKSDSHEAARTELAACLYSGRQLKAALVEVRKNLTLYPDSQWVEYWRFLDGQIPFRLWRYAEAKASLEQFLKDYPDGDYSDHARAYLGRIDPPMDLDEHGIVAYKGKFAEDVRLKAAIAALPGYLEEGYGMLEERLGVQLKPHTHVIYSFVDMTPKTGGGAKATTRVIGVDNEPTTIVYFYTESVVTDPAGYHTTAIHELKHAGFIGVMGDAYHDLPKWIREGLALWGSNDIDERVRLLLCNEIAGKRDPLGMLDGIEDVDHNYRDYMEDVLAFEWLESKAKGNVKAFCKRLVAGEDYRAIWADLSGLSYAEAMAQADAHCRQRVEAALGEAYPAFKTLREQSDKAMQQGGPATRAWLNDGGEAGLRDWLDNNAEHPAAPMARLSLARALVIAGLHQPGRVVLQHVLDNDGDVCTLLDDAQFWIGVSYNYQRDQANAREAFGVLLRDYPNSSNCKQVRGKFPVAGPVTE